MPIAWCLCVRTSSKIKIHTSMCIFQHLLGNWFFWNSKSSTFARAREWWDRDHKTPERVWFGCKIFKYTNPNGIMFYEFDFIAVGICVWCNYRPFHFCCCCRTDQKWNSMKVFASRWLSNHLSPAFQIHSICRRTTSHNSPCEWIMRIETTAGNYWFLLWDYFGIWERISNWFSAIDRWCIAIALH